MPREVVATVDARPPVVIRPAVTDDVEAHRPRRVLVTLGVVALLAAVGFLTIGVKGSWVFALQLRATRLAAMVVVAVAIGYSTVVFQTITTNRILTPSIMGFDSLYLLVQSVAVFFLGAVTVVSAPPTLRFAAEVAIMVVFAAVLFRRVFRPGDTHLFTLVLAGIVLGFLFDSVRSFVVRLIDPNEFLTLQDLMFASLGSVDESLLALSAVVVAITVVMGWRTRHQLDVMALGRDHATNLGVDHHHVVGRQLAMTTVLVSVSTALIGPILFLGLLVANLARQVLGTHRHTWVLPGAALLGVIALVGGQLVLERLLGFGTALTVVINLVGGTYFLLLLLREARS